MAEEDMLSLKLNPSKDDLVCTTQVKFRTFRLKWTIENYPFLSATMKSLKSPEFPLSEVESKRWFIVFEPGKNSQQYHTDDKTYIGSFILKAKDNTEPIKVRISQTLENTSGLIYYLNKNYICMIKDQLFTSVYIDTKSYNQFSSNESLIINCKLEIFDSTQNISTSRKPLESNNFTQDMYQFFSNDQNFKDVTISVQEKIFQAHKAVLAARSEVFAAMLSNEMLEKINSYIEIKDLTPQTAEKMLNFMYNDKVDDLDLKKSAPELLAAAEKYNLKRLKEICIAAMHENLDIENVIQTLKVADIYSIADLKKEALKFINANREIMKSQDNFKTFIAERPHLVMELIDIQHADLENFLDIIKG